MNAFETDGLLVTPEKRIRLEVGMASIPSEAHPDRNEDAGFADPLNGTFGIFDGMGGSKDGRYASQTASRIVRMRLADLPADEMLTEQFLEKYMQDTLLIAEKGVDVGDTTATFFKIWEKGGEKKVTFTHIGDSRLCLYKPEFGTLTQLTEDHGVLLAIKQSRRKALTDKFDTVITESQLSSKENIPLDSPEILTAHIGQKEYTSERELFYLRHILIGSLKENVQLAQTGTRTIGQNSILVLYSDGIPDNRTKPQILGRIKDYAENPQQISEALVQDALLASRNFSRAEHGERVPLIRAKPDDMFAELVKIH